MPQEIKITLADVAHAEKILLPAQEAFDSERVDFITNLETIDLQAVPGSGKTTALLAKLICLERKMPLENGAGVLVISHTNSAVDEIKNKLTDYCPQLFQYPNFVGTIQSFVNHFLAIPFYAHKYQNKVSHIDGDLYTEKARQLYHSLSWNGAKGYIYNQCGKRRKEAEKLCVALRYDVNLSLTKGINGAIFLESRSKSDSYKQLRIMKDELLEQGILHFDDAYLLAQLYLRDYPGIVGILQKRFRFIFVDEMQDMDKHQYELLETVFFGDGNSECVYQRIGDKNQAIHTNIESDDCWLDRNTVLKLNGSHRLSKEIARVVCPFGIEYFEIEGRNSLSGLKPHIIVFQDPSEVLSKYASIIHKYQAAGSIPIPVPSDRPICAIGWRSEHLEEDRLGISDYHPGFRKEMGDRNRTEYNELKDYLHFHGRGDSTIAEIRKNILNAFLRVLRIENITDVERSGRSFTQRRLMTYLKENRSGKYDDLKANLFKWAMEIVRRNNSTAMRDIQEFIPRFICEIWERHNLSASSHTFINSISFEQQQGKYAVEEKLSTNNYVCEKTGVEVQVGTIHSVKGRTHTATLYVECYYYNYEVEKLIEQMKGNRLDIKAGKRVKQSAKMMYVGFSRPTHLLCFAIHKSRFEKFCEDINKDVWLIE